MTIKKVFLLVLLDGEVITESKLTEDDFKAACNGYVTIIDITDPEASRLLVYEDEDVYQWQPVDHDRSKEGYAN